MILAWAQINGSERRKTLMPLLLKPVPSRILIMRQSIIWDPERSLKLPLKDFAS